MRWKGKALMFTGLAFVAIAGFGIARSHGARSCGIGGGAHGEKNPHHSATHDVEHGGAEAAHAEKDCPLLGVVEAAHTALDSLKSARKALEDGETAKAEEAIDAAIERMTVLRKKADKHCPMKKGSARPVNVKCPMMGSEVDPDEVPGDLKRTFRGETVGFCCPPCLGAWDELSEEEKADKLEEARGADTTEEISWNRDLESALAEAAERDTLVVAEFHAEWCGWCQKMEEETLSDSEVKSALRDFTLLKVDTDEQTELARRFEVTGLPTTVIMDAEGETMVSRSGFMPKGDYLQLLKSVQ